MNQKNRQGIKNAFYFIGIPGTLVFLYYNNSKNDKAMQESGSKFQEVTIRLEKLIVSDSIPSKSEMESITRDIHNLKEYSVSSVKSNIGLILEDSNLLDTSDKHGFKSTLLDTRDTLNALNMNNHYHRNPYISQNFLINGLLILALACYTAKRIYRSIIPTKNK
ncbi:hypothetical protein HYU07_05600 [Candidatus Woesearchaeota archaeon]|nr:hypothetical protein [Candidatus Woesearchaeota archaeon]